MQEIFEILNSENYIVILTLMVIVLFAGFISLLICNIKLNSRYKNFMKKLSRGKNIEEDLENFIIKVENVEKQNNDIITFCKGLDDDISRCIQKIGVVRYSAFKDTGSDLSFAVALLDEKNNGVVFNGIYSREMSNIYAKPVENGNSRYTLSEEENQAIEKAINTNNMYKAR